jgi:putative transposase
LKFLGYLSEGVERYRVKAHCFVLMQNHFHLVVTTTEANLSKWMHQLKTAYTVYFNRRYQLVGHLFQGRFRSTVIEADKYLLEVSRYLHLNPVRGKVLGDGTPIERRDRLREYRWSSYRGYAGLEKRKPFVDGEAIERVFETYSGQSWKSWRYRRWLEEALTDAIEDPFEAIQWQQVLGGEDFCRKLKDYWSQKAEPPKEYGWKRQWSAPHGTAEILGLVSKHFKKDIERLKSGRERNDVAGQCAITLCWDYAGLSHSELANLFGLGSSGAVAQTIRRAKAKNAQTLELLKTELRHQ